MENETMRKIYQSPEVEIIALDTLYHLLDWSADREPGGGGNVLESNFSFFDDEEVVTLTEEEYDDDEENDSIGGFSKFSLWN